MHPLLPRLGVSCSALALLLAGAVPAHAARLHVLPGGERLSGVSSPQDWSPANCYPSLAMAAQAASPADSLLLSRDDHPVAEAVVLAAFLGNADLDGNSAGSRLLLEAGADLRLEGGAPVAEVRGIEFTVGGTATAWPALRVLPPANPGHSVRLESCAFRSLSGSLNASSGGAGLHVLGGSARVAVTVVDTVFEACTAMGSGGAVYAADGVDLLLQGCTFTANEARSAADPVYGGAVAVLAGAAGATLTVENCTITGSVSWGPGGAVYAQDAPLTLRDTEIRDSRSAFGGLTNWSAGAGVFLRRAGDDLTPIELIAERCSFVGNRGDLSLGTGGGDGGGMMIRGSDSLSPVLATIRDCLFQDNFNDQGAGLYVGRGVNATIERSYFLDNTAHTNGGGAYKGGGLAGNLGETAFFSYCVFAGNRAGWDQNDVPIAVGGFGGAFMVRRFPRAEFQNCTFADNLSGPNGHRGDAIFVWNEGFALNDERQRSRLVNCLFYGSTGNATQVLVEYGGITEAAHCAWEPGEFVAILAPTPGKVEFSGSPFEGQDTWRLPPGSLCIDAGASVASVVDIDGVSVPSGAAPDIGAFETPSTVSAPVRPAGLRLHPIWPNPANPHAVVAFDLDRSTRVRLSVYDLAGRRVAVLTDAWMAAGEHRVVWEGRDAQGHLAASGLYLVRLDAAQESATRKLMLVR